MLHNLNTPCYYDYGYYYYCYTKQSTYSTAFSSFIDCHAN